MNLNDTQRQLLEETFCSLLSYANDRLDIVGSMSLDSDDEDARLRATLVARALWRHVELIDDYVRANPDHLSRRHLEVARGLSGVLYDDFVFEGMQHGRAVFLHETGTYHAIGVTEASLARLPSHPARLRAALAPFQGLIVAVTPIVGMGDAPESVRASIRSRQRASASETPTSDGDVLSARARAHRERRRSRLEAEARPSHDIPAPGPGYHRGVLTGRTGLARQRAIDAHYDLIAHESGAHRMAMEARSLEARVFPMTLAEGLGLLDDDWLQSIAEPFDDLDAGAIPSRSELIDVLCERLVDDREQCDVALLWCEDEQFELVRRLIDTNPLCLDRLAPSAAVRLFPMLPYVFILHEGDSFVAWMPPEIRSLVTAADLDAIAHVRTQLSQVAHAADALASMCGAIALEDAYRLYHEVADHPLEREQFDLALVELETCDRRDSYAMWAHDGQRYLVSAELADQSALTHVARASYADRIFEASEIGEEGLPSYLELRDEDEDEFRERLGAELDRLETARITLLASQGPTTPHPLCPELLSQRFVDHLMETEPFRCVRDYVDRHIPDDEDDYLFPTTFVRCLIVSALFVRDPYDDVLDIIRLLGMRDCEGNAFPHTLGRLVTNAYNALPNWGMRGWSLEENTERLTGRHRSYHPDGTLVEVGA